MFRHAGTLFCWFSDKDTQRRNRCLGFPNPEGHQVDRSWLQLWFLANLATRSFQFTSRRCYLRWHQLVVAAKMFYGNQELCAAEPLCPRGSEVPAAVSRRWNQEQREALTPKVLPWFQW